MTSRIRRAGAFALVGTLALTAPVLREGTVVPFLAIAALSVYVVTDGWFFDVFARPGDRHEGRLYGLAGFSLAATALGLLATVPLFGYPVSAFVATVVGIAYGNLGSAVVQERTQDELLGVAGFVGVGFVAGVFGQLVVGTEALAAALPKAAFVAASGMLLAALLRTVLYQRDDPLVITTVGIVLWLFAELAVDPAPTLVASGLLVVGVLGYLSYALRTASVPGMLTGVLVSLLTIVLGGFAWFSVLFSFYAIGGLSTKFRYEEKRARGVAEANEGTRGSGNVLANSTTGLLALLAYAATPRLLPLDGTLFLVAFAGAIATALSDTLSSEIGAVFDGTRLITTLEPVEPGTDGGVTWQGEVAGAVGSGLVGLIAALTLDVGVAGAVTIAFAGVAGMTADSLFGATIEGRVIGNQGVNFLATLVGAALAIAFAVSVGLAVLP